MVDKRIDSADGFVPQTHGFIGIGSMKAIAAADGMAYVVSADSSLNIFDVSDASAAILVGQFNIRSKARAIGVADGYVYLGTSEGLMLIDVSNPERPLRAGGFPGIDVYDLTLSAGRVLLAAGVDGLIVLKEPSTIRLRLENDADSDDIALHLRGVNVRQATIQRSSNLVEWEDWRTVDFPEPNVRVTDEINAPEHRFYRAIRVE